MATVFGAIPLILATGAGANSLITIGVVVFFGVTFATILTLFFIPVFYSLLSRTKPRGHVARAVTALERQYDSSIDNSA
jgi:multidrug efflux pump